MSTFLIVVAGSLGCVARWMIEANVSRRRPEWRSWSTMGVNILGATVTGFVIFASYRTGLAPANRSNSSTLPGGGTTIVIQPLVHYGSHGMARLSPFLLTGFCGGFTTFSSALAIPYLDGRAGHRLRAVCNIALTPIFCFVGFAAGEMFVHVLF